MLAFRWGTRNPEAASFPPNETGDLRDRSARPLGSKTDMTTLFGHVWFTPKADVRQMGLHGSIGY
jgi:hypothetical protein